MFDSLLNSKFYNKCKYAFKCIRTRMAPIRRKKHAMIRFLKKDVADLLANGLDTHAFGRMDGLIVELNRASCYDMIEGFCDYIGKQLGSLQKQRECPPEFREAVSTLIFAAARYPDLPELCDLRHIFTERFGNFDEPFVSREFIRKLDSTQFTNEERLQVMQSVAEELSVSFDAKELQLKLWATPETEHDEKEPLPKSVSPDESEKEPLPKSASPVDTNRKNTQKDVQKLNRRAVRSFEKELMEAVELDLNGLPKNGLGAVKFPETEGSKAVQLNVKPIEAVRDCHIEKENGKVLHGSRMPGGPEHNGRHADSGLRAQRPDNQGRPVSPLNGNSNTRNKAAYTKRNVANMKSPTEKQANSGLLHDKPQHLADLGYPVQKGHGVPERAVTVQHVKPKSNIQPVNHDPEKQTPSGYSKPKIPGQIDHLENKDVLRPVSVRRRTAKLPAPVDVNVEVSNNAKVTSQTPQGHRSHSRRQIGAKYDQNRKCNVTDDVGSGTNVQRTPSSQSKHIGRRNGTLNHNIDYSRLMQRRKPEADDTAIDFGNLLPRNANGQRRQNNGRNGDLDEEEERMMDKLLMHYSKKKVSDPTNNEAHIDAVENASLHPPGRAISLPPESSGPGEDAKVPARSTSLQPDGPRSAHVHPKMPDFDELTARVKALRKAS